MTQMLLSFMILLTSMMVIRAKSPYFGALAMAFLSLLISIMMFQMNLIFSAMILVLIYLGGMLVVFVYSTAYSADLIPLPMNLTLTVLVALIGTTLITLSPLSTMESFCETNSWTPFMVNYNSLLFDLYERGYLAFTLAILVLTILLFSILEIVSHRQMTIKWFYLPH
uniref:NADH-ubiquinone oxidoreductase chain 6 n=1 Tax=Asymmetron sp. A TK-2007 TaxID=426588 RepID=A7X7E8_9BRAN|nr:NADH dehydrogenase subunit 6 [Asymmetron sp. A TK-2007]BAF76618.1 NADH dehydrogenase subunit 6 [Asymmetron sp. A TK-2007]